MLPDHDASSVCSNSSNNNDEVASNRSCSPADASEPIKLPDRFKRLISGEEGRSCARTDVVFVHSEKPKKDTTCSREVSVSKESSSKAEVRVIHNGFTALHYTEKREMTVDLNSAHVKSRFVTCYLVGSFGVSFKQKPYRNRFRSTLRADGQLIRLKHSNPILEARQSLLLK